MTCSPYGSYGRECGRVVASANLLLADAKPTRRVATDGGMVVEPETRDSDAERGCPHDHPNCEVGSGMERPVRCWNCFEARFLVEELAVAGRTKRTQ